MKIERRKANQLALVCECGICDFPFVEVYLPTKPGEKRLLVFKSRHHGDTHRNYVDLDALDVAIARHMAIDAEHATV